MICRTILNETSYFGKGAIKGIAHTKRANIESRSRPNFINDNKYKKGIQTGELNESKFKNKPIYHFVNFIFIWLFCFYVVRRDKP